MKISILVSLLGVVVAGSAHAASADRYILDQKMSSEACLNKTSRVAGSYGLTAILQKPSDKVYVFESTLVDNNSEGMGTAYYRDGVCHIYVK